MFKCVKENLLGRFLQSTREVGWQERGGRAMIAGEPEHLFMLSLHHSLEKFLFFSSEVPYIKEKYYFIFSRRCDPDIMLQPAGGPCPAVIGRSVFVHFRFFSFPTF
jgi:hypothetical protein